MWKYMLMTAAITAMKPSLRTVKAFSESHMTIMMKTAAASLAYIANRYSLRPMLLKHGVER